MEKSTEVSVSEARVNFIKQQGFEQASDRTCDFQYPALMFQPRLIGVLVLAGVLLQSSVVFVVLSAVLWWNVLLPKLNPFDRLYNSLVAAPKRLPLLTTAPAPRRFSQGVAATLTLFISMSLLADWKLLAWVLEAILLVALGALIFGAFCLGAFLFHHLTGNGAFAKRTLPWRSSFDA